MWVKVCCEGTNWMRQRWLGPVGLGGTENWRRRRTRFFFQRPWANGLDYRLSPDPKEKKNTCKRVLMRSHLSVVVMSLRSIISSLQPSVCKAELRFGAIEMNGWNSKLKKEKAKKKKKLSISIIGKKKLKLKKWELVKIDVKPMFQLYIDGMHWGLNPVRLTSSKLPSVMGCWCFWLWVRETNQIKQGCMNIYICVCVCVWEREREREVSSTLYI